MEGTCTQNMKHSEIPSFISVFFVQDLLQFLKVLLSILVVWLHYLKTAASIFFTKTCTNLLISFLCY